MRFNFPTAVFVGKAGKNERKIKEKKKKASVKNGTRSTLEEAENELRRRTGNGSPLRRVLS